MAKLSPLNDKLLVEPEIVKNEKDLGEGKKIFLADESKKKMEDRINKGVVLEIGPNVTQVSRGDTIITYPFAKSEVEVDGKIYHLISEGDVLAVWK